VHNNCVFNSRRELIRLVMRAFVRFCSSRTNLKLNPIEENIATKEFRIKLNGDFATVEFKKINETTYDLLHTNIPKTYQGKGLGPVFAERIFDHLIQRNSKMKITCEFLQKFLNSNKEKYKDHVLNS
ncbi:hypothetical protein NQ318_002966, partial [Aromia moschata]